MSLNSVPTQQLDCCHQHCNHTNFTSNPTLQIQCFSTLLAPNLQGNLPSFLLVFPLVSYTHPVGREPMTCLVLKREEFPFKLELIEMLSFLLDCISWEIMTTYILVITRIRRQWFQTLILTYIHKDSFFYRKSVYRTSSC